MDSLRRKDVGAIIEIAIEALLFNQEPQSTYALALTASLLLRRLVVDSGREPFDGKIDDPFAQVQLNLRF